MVRFQECMEQATIQAQSMGRSEAEASHGALTLAAMEGRKKKFKTAIAALNPSGIKHAQSMEAGRKHQDSGFQSTPWELTAAATAVATTLASSAAPRATSLPLSALVGG